MPEPSQYYDKLKAMHSIAVLFSIAQGEAALSQAIQNAREHFPGWSLHNAVQFGTGKRFLRQLTLIKDSDLRRQWAVARIFALAIASQNNWSAATLKWTSDPEALNREAQALLESIG